MKIIFSLVFLILLFSLTAFALDEETYIKFTVDSIITAHNLKGKPQAMEVWMKKMHQMYPDIKTDEWQQFEINLSSNQEEKKRVYDRILQDIQHKGYNASISNLGKGQTIIKIEE